MLAAQATIAAGNQVLAAAGLAINTPPCQRYGRTPTTAERIQRLRKLGPLTSDQRPSELLRRILGRDIDDDEIAKDECLRRLLAQTQLIVRSQKDIFRFNKI